VGYAEVINAGKSRFNEDQATVVEGKLIGMNGVTIPYLYVGVFDGHGGPGAALKVKNEVVD
jgi:protein phosphatase 1H